VIVNQTGSDGITIRPVRTPAECRHVQIVMKHVWQSSDRELVPTHVLITVSKNGGVLLGAFAPDGPSESSGMVGFIFGWPGYGTDERGRALPKHCSHQLAVLPRYRRCGLGLRLKLAQREAVLAQGATEWITWTFDPLQRGNAIFNLHHLGASSNTYLLNVYGDLEDAINAGLPTDRLQVDWRLRSPRVLAAIPPGQGIRVRQTDELRHLPAPEEGVPDSPDLAGLKENTPLAVPLPESIDTLRTAEPARVSQWRYYLRSVLPAAFERGYQLTDCIALPDRGSHYILSPS
jgi:predicted GNAT superfamily acetyltransferase